MTLGGIVIGNALSITIFSGFGNILLRGNRVEDFIPLFSKRLIVRICKMLNEFSIRPCLATALSQLHIFSCRILHEKGLVEKDVPLCTG